jgi:hypothetical protein
MEDLIKTNNSKEMGTQVEIFVIEETAELIYDGEALEKWNKYVDELGLTGQKSIVKEDKSPIPFMHLKTSLKNVFETLCPTKVDVDKYNVTPIPLEILDVIALSKREGYFEKIQIWYDNKSPDPVCIGMNYKDAKDRKSGYEWNMEHYLLGKWADVKRSFSELTKLATQRYIKEQTASHKSSIKYYQSQLDDMETLAFNRFGDNSTSDLPDLPF